MLVEAAVRHASILHYVLHAGACEAALAQQARCAGHDPPVTLLLFLLRHPHCPPPKTALDNLEDSHHPYGCQSSSYLDCLVRRANMTQPTILVTGATGNTGGAV